MANGCINVRVANINDLAVSLIVCGININQLMANGNISYGVISNINGHQYNIMAMWQ